MMYEDCIGFFSNFRLGMNPDNVTGKERERVKRVVYAVIYGVGKERLAELIQSSPSTAQDLVKSFLRK